MNFSGIFEATSLDRKRKGSQSPDLSDEISGDQIQMHSLPT